MGGWAQTVERINNGAVYTSQDGNSKTELTFYSPAIVRVVKYQGHAKPQKESLSVTMQPQKTAFTLKDGDNMSTLASKQVIVKINKQDGSLTFTDLKGNSLLKEKGAARFTSNTREADRGTWRVAQTWTLDQDEPLYGLGQLQQGKLSLRNSSATLMPYNVGDGLPYFASVKGYGVMWDNYSHTHFNDNAEGLSLESEVGKEADYYFLFGPTMDGTVKRMRELTGDVPMLPLWTYGFHQSRERYNSQCELLDVFHRYRKDGVPIDGMVQDWQYWGTHYLWNAMEFLSTEFTDAQGMIDELHKNNAHLSITLWQSFGPHTKGYRQLSEKGLLFPFKTWPESGVETWPPRQDYPSGVKVYNAFNAEARDIYWQNLTRLYKMGLDGWWMDSTEPDHVNATDEEYDTPTGMGSYRSVHNAFPLMCTGGVYDHHRATEGNQKRVFIFTRSATLGQQRYGANLWTGDVVSTWQSLRNQVPAELNFSITGNPLTNSDLGGFFAGAYNKGWNDGSGAQNPAYRELYVRWIQQGVTTPMMRSHGTEVPREFYYYGKAGEPVYDALVGAVKLRYKLLPYTYSTSWQVHKNQASFMRALPMAFPEDKNVWNNGEEYMYGSEILAAPVLHAQYTDEVKKEVSAEDGWNKNEGVTDVASLESVDFSATKEYKVYLPKGTTWYDLETGQRYDGGQDVTLKTTIATVPLFVKAGGIVPLGPDVQYTGEKSWDSLELRVFPGANGSFTLYEDEGDNYNYEQGKFTEIPILWNDKTRTLTIGARRGGFDGMIARRTFNINMNGSVKTVNYSGKAINVKF